MKISAANLQFSQKSSGSKLLIVHIRQTSRNSKNYLEAINFSPNDVLPLLKHVVSSYFCMKYDFFLKFAKNATNNLIAIFKGFQGFHT